MSTFNGQPLFHTKNLVKEAYARLSHDRDSWETEIMDLLHEQYPYLSDHPVRVIIKKADEDEGHGIGSINIDEAVKIPVIVRSSRIQPFDMFMDKEGDIHAFSRESLESALQPTEIGKAVNPSTTGSSADSSLTHRVLPPFDGKYAYAGLYDSLEVAADELAGVLKLADPHTVRQLSKNAKFRKLAKKYLDPVEAVAEPGIEVHLLGKTASLQEIDGFSVVQTDAGPVEGYLAKNVTSINGQPLDSYSVFLSKEGSVICGTKKIVGQPIDYVKLAETVPNLGDTAVAVWAQDGALRMTEPFTVKGVSSDTVKVATMGRETEFRFSEGADEAVSTGSYTYLPKHAQLMKVSEDLELAHPLAEINKQAGTLTATLLDTHTVRLHGEHEALGFERNDAWMGVPLKDVVEKIAEVTKEPVKGFLTQLSDYGHGALEIKKVASVEFDRVVEVSDDHKRNILMGLNEVYGMDDETMDTFCKMAETSKKDVKTVDSVLGLNFLNRERQSKFVDGIPVLEDAMKIFAKLLIASRLGLGIESEPIRSALFSVDAVIRDLRELNNVS